MAKVKVRIAVAVDVNGNWASTGWGKNKGNYSKKRDDEMMEFALETLEPGEAQYFIEAELDIPTIKTISATVSKQN